ncbi:Receptor-like protein 13 [Citrus sinensis]|nr:Receptor-like protein 13 [Citrus sinensis]
MEKFSILLALIALLVQMHGYKACFNKERSALLDREYADEILTSWVDDGISDCCDWERVTCDATAGQVIQLSLDFARMFDFYNSSDGFPILNFSLFLPFQELQILDLSGNYFDGWNENKDYDSSGSSKKLKILNLNYNNFNDSVLPYLNTLTSLTTLNLYYNRIGGLNPSQGNLTNLEVLDLSANRISGSLIELAPFRNLKVLGMRNNLLNGSVESKGICQLKNLTELDLRENNLEGQLPWRLSDLTGLKVFDISSNQLSGNLPSVIANLTSLEYLVLSDNNFQGEFPLSLLTNHSNLEVLRLLKVSNNLRFKTENWIPTFQLKVLQLPNCSLKVIPSFLLHQYNLKFLDLSSNKLVGNFPTWLMQNNTNLEVLRLSNNSFSGILQLPKVKHDFLRHLDISNNNLIGTLPQNMGTVLQKLMLIDISKNNFEGNIPYSIGEMKELFLLDLSRNKFSGDLSATSVNGCASLEYLDVSENNFYGHIFPTYMNLTQLRGLYLKNNHFTGKIKAGLLNSHGLVVLDISNNLLSGHIPCWIGNFSYLDVLLMSKNHLEGNIPVQINNFRQLEILYLSENRLFGSIASFLNLSSIMHLYLQKNALSGQIPSTLLRSTELLTLDLRDNKFFGRIPHQINKHSELRVLLLRGNYLQGEIPIALCQLQKLRILDLSHNKLNGSIPSCFANVLFWREGNGDLYGSGLDIYFQFGGLRSIGTYYNSTLDLWLSRDDYATLHQRAQVQFVTKNRYEFYNGSSLNYMSGMDLSYNELTGEIPSEIGELPKVRALNLSHTSLSGSIPGSFSNLKMMESLDLSDNELSGQIPMQLTELNALSDFNVSYNNLFGPIPDKGQFATFDDSSYRGNSDLCGPLLNKSCGNTLPPTVLPPNHAEQDESAIDMDALYWSFIGSYVTILLGLLVTLWINSYWRRQWFYLIDGCIDSCFYQLFKYVFHQ